jgi:protoporphyrinogen oxidase
MGGISRTVNYKGNRIDIGGHRFFSKSDRVMEWWLQMLPLQASEVGPVAIKYHSMERQVPRSASGTNPAAPDTVMLLRARKSRIYYLRRFFDYPISLSKDTLLKLGLWRTFKIGVSYVKSAVFPLKHEETLEQFFINRFGRELYGTFFKSYTEKVWGGHATASARSGVHSESRVFRSGRLDARIAEGVQEQRRRHWPERHRDLADRTVSLP